MKIQNFNIPAAFKTFNTVKELAPIAENANGKFSLDFKFSSDLDYYLSPLYETVNGKGRFQSKNIQLTNVKALTTLANLSKWEKLKNPSVKDVDLKFVIKNGNITVEPTKMELAGAEIEFGGTQSLDKKMDYDLKMDIPRKEFGEGVNKAIDNLFAQTGTGIKMSENIKLNAKIVGTVDNPKVKLAGSKDGGVKDAVKEEVGEEAKKYIGDADKEVKKLIADAEKEADKIRVEAKKTGDNLIKEADKQGDKLKKEADKQSKNLITEADKQAEKLINEAKNPIAKIAAKKSAELLQKEAKKSADKINAEADKNAKKLHNEAKEKADKLNEEADKKANQVIEKATNESDKIKNKADNKADNL